LVIGSKHRRRSAVMGSPRPAAGARYYPQKNFEIVYAKPEIVHFRSEKGSHSAFLQL